MRDLNDYQKKYLAEDFEKYKVIYRRKKALEIIEKYKPKNILEVGCGMDPLFQHIESTVENYVFFEPGSIFYQNAVSLIGDSRWIHGINEPYSKEVAKKMNIPYDLVICTSLLHELENPRILVRDIAAISNEKTIVHFSVPNGRSFHRLLAQAMQIVDDPKEFSKRNIDFQQKTVYDSDSFEKLVRESGFEVEESGDYFIKPFTHEQMQKIVNHGIIDDNVLDGLYFLSKLIPGVGSELYINCKRKRE